MAFPAKAHENPSVEPPTDVTIECAYRAASPTAACDELPGIKKALEQGDMDYVTDERTEWMAIEIELARAVVAAAREINDDPAIGALEVALKCYDALRVPISE